MPTALIKGQSQGGPKVRRERSRIFVTWYPYCRRSDALAEQIEARSYLVHYFRFKVPWLAPIKYVLQTLKTLVILFRERPTDVIVASPPITAPFVVWLLSRVFAYRFVIDAHSGVFQHTLWAWSLPLQRFLSRRALATVVTNDHLASLVRSWGARAELIQDLSLDLDPGGTKRRRDGFNVVLVCTYSVDEPIGEVLEAARRLPDVRFSFTGDPSYMTSGLHNDLPANVELTGFLPDDEYLALLRGADIIISLTTDDHTMQRGGYEAVALDKPLITSDWPLLREVFRRGTIHVDNSPDAIASAIRRIQIELPSWSQEMAVLRRERQGISKAQIRKVLNLLGGSITEGESA